nr:hypothetical protein [Gemmataceae bacterium]
MKTKQRVRKVILSDPEWERMKSARRNLKHDDAVQESAFLQKQFYQLWGHVVPKSPVDLNEVLRTLIRKRIPFVLTGAHGIGGWTGRPRATKDVDILVKAGRNRTRAVNAIKAIYPELEARDFTGMTAFFVPGEKESVIDVVCPRRADLEETLQNPTWTENKEEGLRYRVPSLEEALANKYGAMLSPIRSITKRQMDMVDFSWMVVHSTDEGQQPIDLKRLAALGEMVWPGGGGKEILRLVGDVKAGKAINLDSLG